MSLLYLRLRVAFYMSFLFNVQNGFVYMFVQRGDRNNERNLLYISHADHLQEN